MKKVFFFFFLLGSISGYSQHITARVTDKQTQKPLPYALITLSHQRIIYTDSLGYFKIRIDSLTKYDTLHFDFIGYQSVSVPALTLQDNSIISLVPALESLQPVTVFNCNRTKDFVLNKHIGNIKEYVGPGPETQLIILARYNNNSGRNGWIKNISILLNEHATNLKIPIRLRWYEWDLDKKMPGRELTDTSLIVYPYKNGWNDFTIPDKAIFYPKDWIVFGLEFIYPPEYKNILDAQSNKGAKLKWLNDMKNRWSLSMQFVKNKNETGFYIVNNGGISSYSKRNERFFIRPAIRFTIEVCND